MRTICLLCLLAILQGIAKAASISDAVPSNAGVSINLYDLPGNGMVAKWFMNVVLKGENCYIRVEAGDDLNRIGTGRDKRQPCSRSCAVAVYEKARLVLSQFRLEPGTPEAQRGSSPMEFLEVAIHIEGKTLEARSTIPDRKTASPAIRELMAACEEQIADAAPDEKGAANHTSDGIRQPADGLPKPSR